jgi:hypothetical protein
MLARFAASFAVVDSARGRIPRFIFRTMAVIAAVSLAGCMPEMTRPAGADPADPPPKAGTGYRSTIAPYTSMRPSTAAPPRESWRERNDRVTPPSRPDR